MRRSGMLLPIASLPSPYGIGAFSKEAYEFIDLFKRYGSETLADTAAGSYQLRGFSLPVLFHFLQAILISLI